MNGAKMSWLSIKVIDSGQQQRDLVVTPASTQPNAFLPGTLGRVEVEQVSTCPLFFHKHMRAEVWTCNIFVIFSQAAATTANLTRHWLCHSGPHFVTDQNNFPVLPMARYTCISNAQCTATEPEPWLIKRTLAWLMSEGSQRDPVLKDSVAKCQEHN